MPFDLLATYQAAAGVLTPVAIGGFSVLRYFDTRKIEHAKAEAQNATAKAEAAGKAADHTERLIELAQSITKDTIETQRADLQRTQDLLRASEARVELLRHELDQAIVTASGNDALLTRLKGEIEGREADNARLRTHVMELENEIRVLRARVKQLEGEAANLKQMLETVRRRPEAAAPRPPRALDPVPTPTDDPVIPEALRRA